MLALVLAAHVSLFENVCREQSPVSPTCGLFLTGFFQAMAVSRDACYPPVNAEGIRPLDMDALRKATLASVQERKAPEGKAIHSAIARLYPCKEK